MSNKTITKNVRFSPEEMESIRTKAAALGMTTSKYIRTMVLNGQILKLEVPEYRKTITELNRIEVIFNQIARRLHETNSFYYDDMQNIKDEYKNLCLLMSKYLSNLRLKKMF